MYCCTGKMYKGDIFFLSLIWCSYHRESLITFVKYANHPPSSVSPIPYSPAAWCTAPPACTPPFESSLNRSGAYLKRMSSGFVGFSFYAFYVISIFKVCWILHHCAARLVKRGWVASGSYCAPQLYKYEIDVIKSAFIAVCCFRYWLPEIHIGTATV